jgi:hypothetical protein
MRSFQAVLNLEFISSDLSQGESKRADQLVKEKYSHSSWLERI